MAEPDNVQDDLDKALQEVLGGNSALITSWTVTYEAVEGDETFFGYINGPSGIKPWRARGLHEQALAYMNAEIVVAEMDGDNDYEPEERDE